MSAPDVTWDDRSVQAIRLELANASVALEKIAVALEALPPRLARGLRRVAPQLTARWVRQQMQDCDRMLRATREQGWRDPGVPEA